MTDRWSSIELGSSDSGNTLSGDALTPGAGSILDLTSLPALSGTVHALARYGSRSGTFGRANGLPQPSWVDYNYLGGTQIAVVVPEPSAWALAGIGLAALGRCWRRRRSTVTS